tara:strand:+ start:650 stop:835 length:186 start_codon:yes stop_codon:yes gene_type:complete
LNKKDIKVGQLVRLSNDPHRWSDFVDLKEVGVVIDHSNGRARVLFTSGRTESYSYFSLELI